MTSLDQVSEGFVAYVREALESTRAQAVFSEYMIEYKDGADIVSNPQPDGLPYAIDLTPFEEAAREEVKASGSGAAGADAGGAVADDDADGVWE